MAQVEKMIALYHNLFVICTVLAIVFLILSIVLFIIFDIKNVIAVLSGRAEKKAIKQLEEQSEYTGQLARRSRNKLAGTMISQSGSLAMPSPRSSGIVDPSQDHAVIKTEALASQDTFVPKNETAVLSNDSAETSILDADSTTVLSQDMLPKKPKKPDIDTSHVGFVLERQILMIHTDEKITD